MTTHWERTFDEAGGDAAGGAALNRRAKTADGNGSADGPEARPAMRKDGTMARISMDGIPPIQVVGVGGGGCNAVNRMIQAKVNGVQFVSINTDAQQLERSLSETTIRIGDQESGGLGVGGDPKRGEAAAAESRDELLEQFKGVDMVFIAAGMGGGTGTGAAPVVAECAKRAGALTIAVVTRPFDFEGVKRQSAATDGLERLQSEADTVIVIPNQRLIDQQDRNLSVSDAFRKADEVLRHGIQGITDVITTPGEINLDFNDVKKVMSSGGHALMAVGRASGDDRAVDAAQQAIRSPLLEISIDGATRVLYNVSSSGDLGMFELSDAAEIIREMADPNAEIIMGTAVNKDLGNEIQITVVATGFQEQLQQAPTVRRSEWKSSLLSDLDIPSPGAISTPAFLRQRESAISAANQEGEAAEPSVWTSGGALSPIGNGNGRGF